MGRIIPNKRILEKYYYVLIVLIQLIIGTKTEAQNLFFSNISVKNGLSSNVTNSIVQDKYGFIWIGTQEGLCRYDGTEQWVSMRYMESLRKDVQLRFKEFDKRMEEEENTQ